MMKSIFNLLFSKNNQPSFNNTSFHKAALQNVNSMEQVRKVESEISIFDKTVALDSYQVDEISFEEFKSSVRIERRKTPRKPGETRSAYSTKQ